MPTPPATSMLTSEPAAAPATSTTTDSTAATDTPAAKAPEAPAPGATAEGTAPAAGEAPAGEAPAEGEGAAPAPELELKLPEGFKVDDATLGEFRTLAQEAGLKGEHAQKLVDFHVKAQTSVLEQAEASFAKTTADWQTATKADKEVGGADFEKNLGAARNALRQFGTPELSQALEQSGLGNHPELVRLLVRVAKATAEDSSAGRHSTAVATPANSEEAFLRARYPTMFQE